MCWYGADGQRSRAEVSQLVEKDGPKNGSQWEG